MKLEVQKCTKTDKAGAKWKQDEERKNNVACYRDNPISLTISCRLFFPNLKNKFSKEYILPEDEENGTKASNEL